MAQGGVDVLAPARLRNASGTQPRHGRHERLDQREQRDQHVAGPEAPAERPIDRLLALSAQRTPTSASLAEFRAIAASLDEAAWCEVGARARVGGLEGLLLHHANAAGALDLAPTSVVDALLKAYRTAWIGNRRLRGAMAEALAALAARGVEAVVVKGAALALRYYGEPGLRPAGDIDLLIHRSDLNACCAALEALGYSPQDGMGDPRAFYPLLFHTLVYWRPSGPMIELHWELINLPLYLPRFRADQALWTRAERIEILGQPARYLSPADELRYLALHAVVQHADLQRAIWLVDIVEVVRHLPSSWDWTAFVAETQRLGLATPVLMALLAADRQTPLSLPNAVFETLRRSAASPRERFAWERSFGSDVGVRSPGAVLRHLRAQGALGDRAMLLWRLVGRGLRRWLRLSRAAPPRSRRMQPQLNQNADPAQVGAADAVEAAPPATTVAATVTDSVAESGARSGAQSLRALTGDGGGGKAIVASGRAGVGVALADHRDDADAGLDLDDAAESDTSVVVAAGGADVEYHPGVAYRMAKRALDVSVAAFLLALLSPLFLVVACLVKLDGGPVIYRRAAIGQRQRPFFMLKFRSMRPDADALLSANPEVRAQYEQNFKLPHDYRVTPIGHWLRRFSIDELPQLWNVLRGEMSLVGPRAVNEEEVPLFGDFFAARQQAPAGLTGLWQVSGRASTSYQQRIDLDRSYIRTCSFLGDLRILLRTIPAIVQGKGAW